MVCITAPEEPRANPAATAIRAVGSLRYRTIILVFMLAPAGKRIQFIISPAGSFAAPVRISPTQLKTQTRVRTARAMIFLRFSREYDFRPDSFPFLRVI